MGANQNSSRENTAGEQFELGQDRTTIVKLSAFGTGLGTAAEIQNGASKTTCQIDVKNQIEEQSISS
jgi:hypothetical protein